MPLVTRQLIPNTAYSHCVKGAFVPVEDKAVPQVLVVKHNVVEVHKEPFSSGRPIFSQPLHGTVLQARSVPRSHHWGDGLSWLVSFDPWRCEYVHAVTSQPKSQ